MTETRQYRTLILSVVKHAYIAEAFAAHPRFDFVAVADDPGEPDWVHERNQEYADQYDVPYVHSLEDAVREQQPDVAIVSSQAERHCDLAIRAAELGLHIVVDKPLSTQLSECDRLVVAIEKANVQCLVWNRNFLPALIHARDNVEHGDIGEIRAIHCDFYFAKDAGPPIGSRGSDDPPINWLDRQIEAHADGSDGGVGVQPMGELQVEGIYPLAYIRLLAGKTVRHVFARTTSHFHQAHADNDVDDLATVTLEMDDDVVGSLCIGRIGAASHPEIGEIKLHLTGTEGAMVVSEARPEVGIYYRGQPAAEFRHLRIDNENDVLLVENFIDALEGRAEPILDARGGRDICAVVEAAVRSGRSGRVEAVSY